MPGLGDPLMKAYSRSLTGVLAVLALGLGLLAAGCGDNEPEQRKAFIAFLQQVSNRSGVHVLKPTADDEKAFGDYTKHYAVITSFNNDMRDISQQFLQGMTKFGGPGGARSYEQMAAHREDVVAVGALIDRMQPAIEKRLAQADAEHAALKQPDDLKAVYDATYVKVVAAPAQAIQKSNKILAEGIKASLALADYINAHRDKLTVRGSQITAKDNKTLAEVGAIVKTHQDINKQFQDAQRDGQKLLQGD